MLIKNVNGIDVPCSLEEETSILSEWAANVVSSSTKPKPTAADSIVNSPEALAALKAALAK
mgnify:CR=1 FL=1